MIIQPVKIMELPSEEPGKNVVVVIYRLPINQQFTIRYFSNGGLEKTEAKDTADEARPVYWTHTTDLVDNVPQMQIVITDSAPSAANAKFFIPTVK